MSVLVIGPDEEKIIRAAIERARTHPLTLDMMRKLCEGIPQDRAVMALSDRPRGWTRPPTEGIELPMNYRVAFSFEEQPFAMCLHISISIARERYMPHPQAVGLIIKTCLEQAGLDPAERQVHNWIEEFEPGQHAYNVLFACPQQEGHA